VAERPRCQGSPTPPARDPVRLLPVAVDVVLLTLAAPPEQPADGAGDPADRPLLGMVVRRPDEPFAGRWSLPGTRLAENDDLEDAAAGTLRAAGVPAARHLEQLGTFGETDRDPRGRILSVSHLALVPAPATPHPPPRSSGRSTPADPEAASTPDDASPPDVQWVPALHPPPLAFDHARILDTAVRRLRGKLTYSTVAYGLLPDTFTLSELQGVYEAVLGERLDKRNFRKKVLALGMVEATGEHRRGPHRPAQLHRFRRHCVVELGDVITP